jgi:hypothetical protein
MIGKRAVCAVAAVLCVAFVCVSPAGNLLGLFLYVGIVQSLFPGTISWDAKNAYAKCGGAIADPRIWPASPTQACRAMHLCANEAVLSARQRQALYDRIGKTPGCQEP